VVSDACDISPLAPSDLIARYVSATNSVGSLAASFVRLFDQTAATVFVSRETTDSLREYAARVIGHVAMSLTYDRYAASDRDAATYNSGEGNAVVSMGGAYVRPVTRGASRRRRSNSGAMVAVADLSPFDHGERATVSRAREATRLTGIGMIGRVYGDCPREETPVIEDTRFVGAFTRENVRVKAGRDRRSHRYGPTSWETDARGVIVARTTHIVRELQTDENGRERYRPARYVVTGHGSRLPLVPATAAPSAHKHPARAAAAVKATALRSDLLASLTADGKASHGPVTVEQCGQSTRGAPIYRITVRGSVVRHASARGAVSSLVKGK
jgi:hypothetical protein